MKTYLVYFALLLFSNEIFGQISNNKYDYFLRKIQVPGSSDSRIVVNKKNGDTTLQAYYNSRDVVNNTNQEFTKIYKGTPFFKNGWFRGKLSSEGGKELEFLMAFNIQKNELYIVEDLNKDAVTIKPESFTIEGHHFSKFLNAYYEVIYISNNTLLKEHSCVLHANSIEKTGYEASGGTGEYEGEFVKTSKFFLLKGEEVVQFPKGKHFYALFGDKKPLIEEYIKLNNINLKSENGIVSTLKYYDSLENPQ
ncbi:hypothetical protein EMA8858_01989 [Emticicia aquatica]|uniref:Uncharacterized protein n=1 Tax=Emticicia aquatica TaxID=1681835 RepID=A0ABN8EVB6_9BACT|nr:hypothetical protein [Emticicia aquatica]CAH0995861.1 hypothetical protein EMA8858_01989 [Emticicia aquatica]